jgi:hypothetical protein
MTSLSSLIWAPALSLALAHIRTAWRDLLAVCLHLRRRVEVGLLPAARGRDIEGLAIHRGIGGDVGPIDAGTLRLVGGRRVGVLQRRVP